MGFCDEPLLPRGGRAVRLRAQMLVAERKQKALFEAFLDACRAQLAEQSPRDLRGLVSALRAIITDPANRPFFRLFDEVNALAQTQPDRFPGFGRASVHDWLPQLTELLRPSSPDDVTAQAQATLALAVIRGLMLDDNATGDHLRIEAALEVFDGL